MKRNKELWQKARLALCKSIRRIINKHNECLISLRVSYENGAKNIDLSPDQARRVLEIIRKETEGIQ